MTMEFVLYCLDKAGHADQRTQLRAAHLAYTSSRQSVFRFGGPLLGDRGQPLGSLMILELPDRSALDVHMQCDPFFSEGLFETVTIWVTRQVMPEREPGALAQERCAAQALAGPGPRAFSTIDGN
jgi:uncharacterized protein YciI